MRNVFASSFCLGVLMGICPAMGDEPDLRCVSDVVQRRELPSGAPRASDVIMRSLRLHRARQAGDHDTIQALRDFHVTRLEWAYIQDASFIAQVAQSGRQFGGAASSALSHVTAPADKSRLLQFCCVNLDGQPVVPTWKRTWNPPGNLWICVNNPELERNYVAFLHKYVDAGASVMQRDEPWGNYRALWWGGCFCDHCMDRFRDYLGEHTSAEKRRELEIDDLEKFDYRQRLRGQKAPVGDAFRAWKGGPLKELFTEFQLQATVSFHQRTRQALDQYAGRRVPMSCNNGCRRWTDVELEFDWCFGELPMQDATAVFIHDAMRDAARRGKYQVVTMPKKRDREDLDAWCQLTRQTIATAYACGGQCMVPWDVYMPGDAPRYFGTPDQYADLYGFVRGSQQYLDGYEYAGAFGCELNCALYGDRPPLTLPEDSTLCAVVRCNPQRPDAPVVIHLTDWSKQPTASSLRLDLPVCSQSGAVVLDLLQPVAYQRESHQQADQSGDYSQLVHVDRLTLGTDQRVQLPPLAPWGLLVLRHGD